MTEKTKRGRSATAGPEPVQVMGPMSVREHLRMYWKFFFERQEKKPRSPLPQAAVDVANLLGGRDRGLRAAWLGHSSLLLNVDGCLVLTDPLFDSKVSPLGPFRFGGRLALAVEEIDHLDAVVISHDHYDHLHRPSIIRLVPKTGRFVVPRGVGARLQRWGVPADKIIELDWWQEVEVTAGLMVAATPSRHFSGRGMFDRNRTLWASWVFKTAGNTLFFSGDSGYFPGFADIGNAYGPFDVAFLECGAYDQHWSTVHMFPEQAVQACTDLGGRLLQPVHWATFNLALHPWYEPIERLVTEAERKGVAVATPVIGQAVDYRQPPRFVKWWRPAMAESRAGGRRSLLPCRRQRDGC